MQSFTITQARLRVVFGENAVEKLALEAVAFAKRVLVLSTPRQRGLAERAVQILGNRAVGVCDQAAMHVPVPIVESAVALATRLAADSLVCIGGGSTIGLGKAIALRLGLPIVAIPTTYAGSEMTPIWGLTENGLKRTGCDERVRPRVVIYDPLLTLELSPSVSGPSGMNAIAHCVEALYSENANPLISLMAEEGIRALAHSLPLVVSDPHSRSARADALYGAWLAGTVLGAVGMALHHKLCHTLGGTFNLPHAETHAIVLPHAVQYNTAAAPAAMARVKRALGSDDAAQGLYRLLKRVSEKTGLKDIGMPAEGLKKTVALALTNPYFNPAPLEEVKLHGLLSRAYEGAPPK